MDPRSILQSPLAYMTFQALVGGLHVRTVCLEMLNIQPGEKILDIGCGPAYYLNKMPEVEYFGFDTDQRYIDYARAQYGHRGTFFCDVFNNQNAKLFDNFDCVMLMGLLHHLDDDSCFTLLNLVASKLKSTGRVIALDTTMHQDQNRFDKYLAKNDRGQYVRKPDEFRALADSSFSSVKGQLIRAWWMPSIYWVMVLRHPMTSLLHN